MLTLLAASLVCGCGRDHNLGPPPAAFAASMLVPFEYLGMAITADAVSAEARHRRPVARLTEEAKSMPDFDVYVGGPNPPPLRAALDPIPHAVAGPGEASSESTRARSSLNGAAVLESLDARDLHSCRKEGTPPGWNHARITFETDGRPSRVVIDWTVWMSGSASSCFRSRLSRLRAPAFQGRPQTLGVWFFTF